MTRGVMRMPRDAMALLTGLAHEKSEAAGRRLGRSLALLKESEARLATLDRYRGEYQRRYVSASQAGVAPAELRNFRNFLERLDKAIAQQRAEMEVLARGAKESRHRWLEARTRGKSLDVLADRADDAARLGEARRLQKLVDEFASRLTPLNTPSIPPIR